MSRPRRSKPPAGACPACRKTLRGDAPFCPNCGAYLSVPGGMPIAARMTAHLRSARAWRVAGIIICIAVPVAALYLSGAGGAGGFIANQLLVDVLYFALAVILNLWLAAWLLRLRHGVVCPACSIHVKAHAREDY